MRLVTDSALLYLSVAFSIRRDYFLAFSSLRQQVPHKICLRDIFSLCKFYIFSNIDQMYWFVGSGLVDCFIEFTKLSNFYWWPSTASFWETASSGSTWTVWDRLNSLLLLSVLICEALDRLLLKSELRPGLPKFSCDFPALFLLSFWRTCLTGV